MNKICLFGLKSSGKTSIVKVIFQKMNPQHTFLMEPTQGYETTPVEFGRFSKLQIIDFSSSYELKPPTTETDREIIETCGAVIYVIDIQMEIPAEAIRQFQNVVRIFSSINPKIHFSVFIHKTDLEHYMLEDRRNEALKNVRTKITDDLEAMNLKNLKIDYHLTSIFEPNLWESMSKVIQYLLPYNNMLKKLLDSLAETCGIEKIFLFEIVSKLYLATDRSPVETANFALCSDMIDVYIDIFFIYGAKDGNDPHTVFTSKSGNSEASIKLENNNILYLREIDKYLALIMIMKADKFDKKFLIDYNIENFKQGFQYIFEQVSREKKDFGKAIKKQIKICKHQKFFSGFTPFQSTNLCLYIIIVQHKQIIVLFFIQIFKCLLLIITDKKPTIHTIVRAMYIEFVGSKFQNTMFAPFYDKKMQNFYNLLKNQILQISTSIQFVIKGNIIFILISFTTIV